MPNLPALKHLDLSDNKISKDLERLENCPSLTHLNLAGNNIIEIESLRPLASLRNLVSLDLFNCEVANVEKYRESVFKVLFGQIYMISVAKIHSFELYLAMALIIFDHLK